MNENGGLFLACLVVACIVAWLLLTPAAPMQDAPARISEPIRETRNADGSIDRNGYGAGYEAARRMDAQRRANPEAFAKYYEWQQRCGYAPRYEDGLMRDVTPEHGAELSRRQQACIDRGDWMKPPGAAYPAQPQQQSPWRATRNGLEEREER